MHLRAGLVCANYYTIWYKKNTPRAIAKKVQTMGKPSGWLYKTFAKKEAIQKNNYAIIEVIINPKKEIKQGGYI